MAPVFIRRGRPGLVEVPEWTNGDTSKTIVRCRWNGMLSTTAMGSNPIFFRNSSRDVVANWAGHELPIEPGFAPRRLDTNIGQMIGQMIGQSYTRFADLV